MPNETQLLREAGELFAQAFDMDRDARAEFLRRTCAGRDELRELVSRLLRVDDALTDSGGMASRSVLAAYSSLGVAETLAEGARVGEFTIERVLGQGGMGRVYLAWRDVDGHRQQVALKLPSDRRAGDEVLRRLRRERGLLAMLDHPQIARLIDAGELDDRTPYFAMEYVPGTQIDEYCDAQKLSVGARLKLFLGVCEAVSYAHQRLVLHRDLKPSNVLIDRDGRPRLLDFGIAKPLLDQPVGAMQDQTAEDRHFFSPSNAAPEQVLGQTSTVATDVYGLACLLFRLLCGRSPFDFADADRREIERRIVETPAPLASAVVLQSATTDAGATAAQQRGLASASALAHTLRGDLDAIMAKALRKSAGDRYRTVDALIEDLKAVLEARPIGIRADERWYRARLFVRRHRGKLALAAAAAVVVVGFATITVLQARRVAVERDLAIVSRHEAELQRDHAERVVSFLVKSFESLSPEQALGRKPTAEEMLDAASRTLQTTLDDEPELKALMAQTLSRLFFRLELPAPARHHTELAAQALARVPAPDPEMQIRQLMLEGMSAGSQTHWEEAQTLALKGISRFAQIPAPRDRDLFFELWLLRVNAAAIAGDIPLSLTVHDEAIAAMQNRPDVTPARVMQLRFSKAHTLNALDSRRTEARDLLLEIMGWHEQHPGVSDIGQANTLRELGLTYSRLNQHVEAERYLLAAIQKLDHIYGVDSVAAGRARRDLARVYVSNRRFDQAEQTFRDVLRIYRERLGEDHYQLGVVHYGLGDLYEIKGDLAGAERELRETLRIFTKALGEDHFNVDVCKGWLAGILVRRGRYAEAESVLRGVIERMELAGHGDIAYTQELSMEAKLYSAEIRYHLGDTERAKGLLREELPAVRRLRPSSDAFRLRSEDLAKRLGLN